MGSARNCWSLVAPEIARRTRTAVYDRSGLGRSPADPKPRTLGRLADDLNDLLDGLGDSRYVLVAHSYGGPIVRLAASHKPDRVAGLVLVDQTDEGCPLYFSRGGLVQQRVMSALAPLAARAGLIRFAMARVAKSLPEPALQDMLSEETTVASAKTMLAEQAPLVDDLVRLRDNPPAPLEVPVTLISGGHSSRLGARQRASLVDSHARRAASLPAGRHVMAPKSGHYVQLSEPDVVVAEINRLLDSIT